MKRLKFWCNDLALDAVLDKIPTAKVIEKENEKYLISAEVVGNGAEIWLKGQKGLYLVVYCKEQKRVIDSVCIRFNEGRIECLR